MVLGHDSCGAVTAARNAAQTGDMPPGFIRNLVERILPSVIAPSLPPHAHVNDMVREHTRQTAMRITEQSHIVSDAVLSGEVAVIGVFYHLRDGKAELVFSSQDLTLPNTPTGEGQAPTTASLPVSVKQQPRIVFAETWGEASPWGL